MFAVSRQLGPSVHQIRVGQLNQNSGLYLAPRLDHRVARSASTLRMFERPNLIHIESVEKYALRIGIFLRCWWSRDQAQVQVSVQALPMFPSSLLIEGASVPLRVLSARHLGSAPSRPTSTIRSQRPTYLAPTQRSAISQRCLGGGTLGIVRRRITIGTSTSFGKSPRLL